MGRRTEGTERNQQPTMETREELLEWVAGLPEGSKVGVDDGGLALHAVRNGGVVSVFEIGGIPAQLAKKQVLPPDRGIPGWPESDWLQDVASGGTSLGYDDWVYHRSGQAADPDLDLCCTCGRAYAPAQHGEGGECEACTEKTNK